MRRLVFIDDDETELNDFRPIVADDYEYIAIHWPHESGKLFSDPGPDLFVSDLYLPHPSGDTLPTAAQRQAAEEVAKQVSEQFSQLFVDQSQDDKARLKATMRAIGDAYNLLKLQWSALGQSPDHGVVLLRELKSRFPEVPLVFYSRKITPEDVIRVLKAGAVDAIRKDALGKHEVLARLASAQEIWHQRRPRAH
jgi:DNA-binding NarL/FixJ family response regulator